jgi:hypothetical protein
MSNILVRFCKESEVWEYALSINKVNTTAFGFKYNPVGKKLEAFFTDLNLSSGSDWAYIDRVPECDVIPGIVLEAFEGVREGRVIKLPSNVRVIGGSVKRRPVPQNTKIPQIDSEEEENMTLLRKQKHLRQSIMDDSDSDDEDYVGEEDDDEVEEDDEEDEDGSDKEEEEDKDQNKGAKSKDKKEEGIIEYELGEDDEEDDTGPSKKKPLSPLMTAQKEFSEMCEQGRLLKKYRDLFKKLPAHRSREYLTGKSMYYAIPSDKGKGQGNGKAMCCLYKLDTCSDVMHPDIKCFSKSKNLRTGMLNSDFARFIYAAHLGNMGIRMMKVEDAFIALKSRSICTKCKSHYKPHISVDRTLFYDIFDSRDLCAICKRHCTTSRVGCGIKFMVCSTCFDKSNEKNSEWGLYKTMSTLQNIFEDYVFVIHEKELKNNSFWVLNDDEKLQLYYVDFYMTVQVGDITLLIIIEQDEQEHMGQQKEDNIKMKTQSAYLLAKLAHGDRASLDNIRVVMIRFNPYSGSGGAATGEKNGKDGKDGTGSSSGDEGYDRFSRLVILRQWVIFAITHVEELRTLNMWYMWYTPSRSHTLLYGNTFKEVFGAIYQAPKPRVEHEQWRYCFDPYEGDNRVKGKHEKKYKKIIMSRVSLDEVLPYWRKEKESVILPKDFEVIYTRQLKLLDNPQAYANKTKDSDEYSDEERTRKQQRNGRKKNR